MQKQYQTLKNLISKFGIRTTITYKFLEFRDKHPLANRIFSEVIIGHANSTSYCGSYIASWNSNGQLAYFNPNPNFPEDFRPVNIETGKLERRLTEEELKQRLPIEFATKVHKIRT